MKTLGKQIDDENFEPKKRPYKVNRKPNPYQFKLRDPKTGLFLASNAYRNSEPRFNSIGSSWGSKKAATRNWIEYDFRRIQFCLNAPTLELVRFKIMIEELETVKTNPTDITLAGIYASVSAQVAKPSYALTVKYKMSPALVGFLRNLAEDHADFKFTHIIEAAGSNLVVPEHINIRSLILSYSPQWHFNTNNPKVIDEQLLVAVCNDADLLFLKMALGENVVAIWENDAIIRDYYSRDVNVDNEPNS